MIAGCTDADQGSSSIGISTQDNPTSESAIALTDIVPTNTPGTEPETTQTDEPDSEEVTSQAPETDAPDPLPLTHAMDPADWMEWPVTPIVTQHVQEIYELGQQLGRDPSSFSIFGDCQSTPDTFLGLYDLDQAAFDSLPGPLQDTVLYFSASVNRESPTAKPGTTTGALLWIEWHESLYGCLGSETPVQCELRINNPAFVLLAVGTHYESRNEYYMRIIIEELLSLGIVPILSTKADNREGDHSINLQTAQLAAEYNIPMWNFWALSVDLPENGLFVKAGEEHLGAIYFTDELKDRHRISALETLNAVWQAAMSGP